jgi:NAD(P)-dependent dehydrogenase (short-subunit alcohol dehydrogenase family)
MNKARIKAVIKRLFDYRPVKHTTIELKSVECSSLLKGRCALITGGTSGIGYAIAAALLQAGAMVIVTGRNQNRLSDAVKVLSSKGQVMGFVLDNTDVDSYGTVFEQMISSAQSKGASDIDILVNNAGVNFKGMPNATEEEYDQVMDTNLKGAFFLSQMFGKYLVANKIRGNILNIASASSLRPADSAYTLSKWGLRGLTLGLAKSLAQYGITVNGIAPGPTATPMMKKDETSNMTLDRIPLGRYITPEEIANMAVFLVSDMGRSIMGDIVYMTGGAGRLTYDDVNYSF